VAGEPARGFGEDHHAEEEEDGGDHLDTPGNAEDRLAVVGWELAADVGATEGNAVGIKVSTWESSIKDGRVVLTST
jgi:hypothetical protein